MFYPKIKVYLTLVIKYKIMILTFLFLVILLLEYLTLVRPISCQARASRFLSLKKIHLLDVENKKNIRSKKYGGLSHHLVDRRWQLVRKIEEKFSYSKLLSLNYSLASKCHVKINWIKEERCSVRGLLDCQQISWSLSGNYFQIINFMFSLQQLPWVFSINKLYLGRHKGAGVGLLRASLSLEVYYL